MSKKLILIVVALISFWGIRAQTYSSSRIHVTVVDSMSHDSTSCSCYSYTTYHITVDTSFAGDSLTLVDTAGGALWGAGVYHNTTGASPWIFLAPTEEIVGPDMNVTPGGGYYDFNYPVIKVTTTLDTLRYITLLVDSFWVLPCQWGNVSGNVYIDYNSNCIFDSGDVEVNTASLRISTNYSTAGVSSFDNPLWGSPYTVDLQKSWLINYNVALSPSFAFIFPFSPCFTTTSYTDSVLPRSGVDFPLKCTNLVDVQCYALSPERIRYLRSFYINPYVSNTGCDTVSGTLTLVKDSRTIYDPALTSFPPDTVHGDTLIWNYSQLTNVSNGAYWNSLFSNVHLSQDSTVAVGDTLCFRVYTNIPPTDVDPTNNDYTICLPVVYSYDPNSKSVVPPGTGPMGILPPGTDTLTYTLEFQNTGTDYAQNVVVIDTLDSHLNPQTLRILGTSALMTPQWLASNIVQFTYDNIMLPDSGTNEAASHGQVRFSIAMNAGVPAGTTIKNTGYIYFDTNPAVVTNTTNSTLSTPSATALPALPAGVRIFPNPSTDMLTIDGMDAGVISVQNMNGEVMISKAVSGNTMPLDVSRLPSGVYLLRAISNNQACTLRFTKY